MVQIIEAREEAGDAPYVEFRVFPKPKDPTIVFGDMMFLEPNETTPFTKQSVTITTSNLGVPADEAFRTAVGFAKRRGIPFVWVYDPRGLFPPTKRPSV
jgi:hypothetical protein